MKLTIENAVEIAKKYNFSYDEELGEIVIPPSIGIDDDDFSFMRFEVCEDPEGNENEEFNCAYEFGVTALESGKFGFHTSTFKNITTTEEFEGNIKNFLAFIELVKPHEKKYQEQVKLNKISGDF